uniref:Uncharacterized protein n=1 Tax=Salix viminalis TaxID=40686 RepID=A0A6N2KHQ5_SALVM
MNFFTCVFSPLYVFLLFFKVQ